MNNPVYKKSPFYPFADEVRRREEDKKKSESLVEHFYSKVKNNFKDKIVEQIGQDEKGATEHLKAVFGEYFVKHMGNSSGEEDEEYDDESDRGTYKADRSQIDINFMNDDNARMRGSEVSRRSKLKSATSRSQTPSRSPDIKKSKEARGKRRMGLNDMAREALQNHI